MKPKKLLQELELVAEKLGIQTVYDTFQGRGGGCRVIEDRYIVINSRLADEIKAELFLKALSELAIDEIYIKPEIRELLEKARESKPQTGESKIM
ncbi:hypothetical protein ES703_25752 [subsurface metagenome]|nr:hypothetical protein [bacterium]